MKIALYTAILALTCFAGCRNTSTSLIPKVPPTPAGVAALFHDVANPSGITIHRTVKDPAALTILDMMGFGCAFLDYDGDGRLDVLIVMNDHIELFRNKGNGTFENVTDRAFPIAPHDPYLMGCSVCDYDGDGRPDIFVTGHGRTILYHNQGDGTFRDVTAGSGLEAKGADDWTTSSAWYDPTGKGSPDLYVCRYVRFGPTSLQQAEFDAADGTKVRQAASPIAYTTEVGSLYHNAGNGKFVDITSRAGLSGASGNGLGCMFCDFMNTGHQGLFIANDQRPQDLFVEESPERFENVSDRAGIAYDTNGKLDAGMGVDWADYRGDGRFGLLEATFSNQPKCLFHNLGSGAFESDTARSGIGGASLTSLTFGAKFVDLFNSGLPDIVLVNGHVQQYVERVDPSTSYLEHCLLFHNQGDGLFVDQTMNAGPDFNRRIVGRGIAIGDYDGDGREDLLIIDAEGEPLLLHNDCTKGHYLNLRVLAANGKSDALGARVTIKFNNLSRIAEVRSSGSYLSSDDPELHFGLGSATQADSISVRWPDGHSHTYGSVAADHRYVIRATDSSIRALP